MMTLATKMTIGFKYDVQLINGIKIIANKNRQICVTTAGDLYNIHAFTLRGVDLVREVNINGVFGGDELQKAIIKSL